MGERLQYTAVCIRETFFRWKKGIILCAKKRRDDDTLLLRIKKRTHDGKHIIIMTMISNVCMFSTLCNTFSSFKQVDEKQVRTHVAACIEKEDHDS